MAKDPAARPLDDGALRRDDRGDTGRDRSESLGRLRVADAGCSHAVADGGAGDARSDADPAHGARRRRRLRREATQQVRRSRSWMPWAIAAGVLGIGGIGAAAYLNGRTTHDAPSSPSAGSSDPWQTESSGLPTGLMLVPAGARLVLPPGFTQLSSGPSGISYANRRDQVVALGPLIPGHERSAERSRRIGKAGLASTIRISRRRARSSASGICGKSWCSPRPSTVCRSFR